MATPVVPAPVPHVGGPIMVGEARVLIAYCPAARVGDPLMCVGPPDVIATGEPTVLIGNQPAARMGDMTAHGGAIVLGCPTVLIGSSPQAGALKTDAPFCERLGSPGTTTHRDEEQSRTGARPINASKRAKSAINEARRRARAEADKARDKLDRARATATPPSAKVHAVP